MGQLTELHIYGALYCLFCKSLARNNVVEKKGTKAGDMVFTPLKERMNTG